MSQSDDSTARERLPVIRSVSFRDLGTALRRGWADFCAAPQFGLFFAFVYVAGGLLLFWATMIYRVPWLIYPLVIGFALIGPFIATGLYEVSRRRELGLPLKWSEILSVVRLQRHRELGWMAFVMLFVFWIWVYQARTLLAVFFGSKGFASFDGLLTAIFTTTNGWWFLLAGHIVGAVIGLVLFSLTVMSCPLLLERDIDFVTAMITSVQSVLRSPVVMICWGLFVVASMVLAAVPLFFGLFIVLPVLGHATWHLYRLVLPPP